MGSKGPVVFWKGLEMFQSCLVVSRKVLESSRRVGDVPEGSLGDQCVPRGSWSPAEVSNGDFEDNLT